ncbi:hypothetical protein [Gordonia sp. (in: high G+C Gram-positive bacteria)]|uniref:hypothetical protein n=1 Tax=Gordonia sp. (in: high G+C Gram-positive bacteria) TaxID=84139 RepID=UPI003BB79AAE
MGAAIAAVVASTALAGSAAAEVFSVPALPNGSLGAPVVSKAELDKSFRALTKSMATSLPGRVGVSITPVGGDLPTSFGSVKTARAWSTLKVPVSIAAQRKLGAAVLADEAKAIELSDNESAEKLWGLLGGGAPSVDAVTAVLREGHDVRTQVSSELTHSFPGLTQWDLADQSIFAAHLPCLPDTGDVLDHMNHVAANQQWGVAKPAARGVTAAVKGGWGPAANGTGKNVVRQLAVISTPTGQYGVALAALPTSGSLTDGNAMVTRVGTWLLKNLGGFPAGNCLVQ